MTRYLLDVASYQGSLKPADVKRAGFSVVNLKVSHGLSRKSVHPQVTWWVDQARSLSLGICTFHFMTPDATGAAQAAYAFERLHELGLTGHRHVLDVESKPFPKLADVRAYLDAMTKLNGEVPYLYTGDHCWPPSWNVTDLAPRLWAAPNAGYLNSYPGDTSAHWKAGYGGWANLAVMQYAVEPLLYPDGTHGTIDVSKSAIRDEQVWAALTVRRPVVSYAPTPLKTARTFWLDKTGMNPLSAGIVGDAAHADGGDSYHLGADQLKSSASYSKRESPRDSKPTEGASALDIGWWTKTINGKTHNLRTFSVWLVEECKAGAADTKDIREVIYSPDGKTVKRWDRLGKRSTGDDSHTSHTHVSYFRDSESREKVGLFKRYFAEIEEDDMPTPKDYAEAVVAELRADAGLAALWAGVNQDKVQGYTTDPNTGAQTKRVPTATDNGLMTPASAHAFGVRNGDFARVSLVSLHRKVDALSDAVEALVAGDAANREAILARIDAARAEIVAEIEEAEGA